MAATIFEIVKQGDTYRILYSATSFSSGASVNAIPYNPAGTEQTQINFTQIGTSGIYYYDFDSTGKDLGAWVFVIRQLSVAKAYVRLQVVDANLNDTSMEGIKLDTATAVSELQNAGYGLSAIKTALDVVGGNVDDVEGEVKSGSYGLSVIKSVLDTVASAVTHIQNNTRNNLALPERVLIPEEGSTTRRAYLNIFDTDGNMEDPDSQQVQAKIYLSDGTDVTTDYISGVEPIYLTRDGVGQYRVDYVVESTDTPNVLNFRFVYVEGGSTIVRNGVCELVVSETNLSSQLTEIEGKIVVIESDVDTVVSDVATIKADTTTLKSDSLDIKGTGFSSSTDSLKAIRSAVDSYLANGGTIDVLLDGITDGQAAIKGTGFDTATDSLKAISERVYSGGIAL